MATGFASSRPESSPVPLLPMSGWEQAALPPLPQPLTSLVGRDREAAMVADLLRDPGVRLLTLTGPGGVGKTRLALKVGSDLSDLFPDGSVFVPLAALSDPGLVLPTMAQALGVREAGDRGLEERLGDALRDRSPLLVLDNMEQVVGAAPAVADLLRACPSVKAVVTSRIALRVAGEHEFAVSPLALPDAGRLPPLEDLARTESIALFLQRARAVKHGFALTAENAAAVAEICARLDGLPLAIELAAARVKVLSPAALLARLTDRLRVLTGGPEDQPSRLRTMRDAVAWSYDLLDEAERVLFRRLSIFVGGFTLAAAEVVGGGDGDLEIDVLDGVSTLVDHSLLRQGGGLGVSRGEDESRFAMLETIREYGLEQLEASGEMEAARSRHAQWCMSVGEIAEAGFRGSVEASWLDRVESEHDNLRAALGWLERTGDAAGPRLAGALWGFWYVRSHRAEGHRWLARALAHGADAPPAARAAALVGLGALEHCLDADAAGGVALMEQGLALRRQLGDTSGVAEALLLLGSAAQHQGAHDRAALLFQEAGELFRDLGNEPWSTVVRYHLGVLAFAAGDGQRAAELLREALARNRAQGDLWGIATSLDALGLLACARGDHEQAAVLFEESLGAWRMLGAKEGIAAFLANVATLLTARGEFPRAARLFGAAYAAAEELGSTFDLPARDLYERAVAMLRDRMDEAAFRAAWAAGGVLQLDQAATEAAAAIAPASHSGAEAESRSSSLTLRELGVLRLLVAGRTDKEIAEALFISPRTAQGHVASIFSKLGVNSRTAAATTALASGLIAAESAPG